MTNKRVTFDDKVEVESKILKKDERISQKSEEEKKNDRVDFIYKHFISLPRLGFLRRYIKDRKFHEELDRKDRKFHEELISSVKEIFC